jgi:DNA recombination protein RmuC
LLINAFPMPESQLTALLFLLIGLLAGGLAGWLITQLRMQGSRIPKAQVEREYVNRVLFEQIQQQADAWQADVHEKSAEITALEVKLAQQQQRASQLEERLNEQQAENQRTRERLHTEFENLSNRLLDEKSAKFTRQNQEQLGQLLNPLREKIQAFEAGIEKRFLEETRDRVSLKKEIENLRLLNQQLSQDANNLASALKGDNKTQGDWGELQLERLLEKAGLQKGVHFDAQPSFKDSNGQIKRPDFIIHLPEKKTLIIDSKVSLKAYEQFFQTENEAEQQRYLRAHVDSLRQHIRNLSSKDYPRLYDIYTPDYLLLFVPVEPAFALAVQEDPQLFLDALDANVVLVSTSTLLATMRTVGYIWKQEKQKSSVLEIARQSGLLYDKFVGFVEDLKGVGYRLGQAQNAYGDAMNKLNDSKKFGDTLVGRAERIRELGADASKQLPPDMLD